MAMIISVIFLFMGIEPLIMISVCIVGRMLRRGEPNMVERGGFGSTSMSQEDIEKLPCFDCKEKEKGSSPLGDCTVCLENFRVDEKCRLLPFHAECVDLWLLRTPMCPICRACADVVDSTESLFGEETSSEVQTAENGPGNEVSTQISDREMGRIKDLKLLILRKLGELVMQVRQCLRANKMNNDRIWIRACHLKNVVEYHQAFEMSSFKSRNLRV